MKKEMQFLPKAEFHGLKALALGWGLGAHASGLGWGRCSVDRKVTQAAEETEMLAWLASSSRSPVSRLPFQSAPAPSMRPEPGSPGTVSCLSLVWEVGLCLKPVKHISFLDCGTAHSKCIPGRLSQIATTIRNHHFVCGRCFRCSQYAKQTGLKKHWVSD